MPKIIENKSAINYSYATIKITQSRIDKGLIAIPTSLTKWFPHKNDTIQVYLSNSPISETKRYTSYLSSTHECRIGGMKDWLRQNEIKKGDEIVIQFVDKKQFVYRLIPERNFILKTKELQRDFDVSESDQQASEKIRDLAQWTQVDKNRLVLSEYRRLIDILSSEGRRYIKKETDRARENVPTNLRTLLEEIYKGHCQLCDFWFLKSYGRPYFEIHHLNPVRGHHPKNLVVVCGNCHNQFEHAEVNRHFNREGWLIKVFFNRNMHLVRQIPLIIEREFFVKKLFI